MGRFLKEITHLAEMGHYKLANKMINMAKTGKTFKLSNKELEAFNVVKTDLRVGFQEMVHGRLPGTALRRELFHSPRSMIDPITGIQYGGGHVGRGYFSRTKNVPMVDIDLPDFIGHGPGAYNFKSKKDALENLRDFMKTKIGSRTAWQMHDTPGGIRMFDVSKGSRGAKPETHQIVGKALGGDRIYIKASKQKKGYDMRLMGKPGRKGDYVSKLMKDIRTKGDKPGYVIGHRADIDPRSLDEVKQIHDDLIRLILMGEKSSGRVSLSGLDEGLFGLADLSVLGKVGR